MMKFLTPSKKVEILSRQFEEMGYDALPVYHEPTESPLGDTALAKDYPLVLTTGAKVSFYVHSQMRNIPSLAKHMPHNMLEIHPFLKVIPADDVTEDQIMAEANKFCAEGKERNEFSLPEHLARKKLITRYRLIC